MKKYLPLILLGFLCFIPKAHAACGGITLSLNNSSYSATVGSFATVNVSTTAASGCAASSSTLQSNYSGSYIIIPPTGSTIDCQGGTCSYAVSAGPVTVTSTFSIGCDTAGTYNLQAYSSASVADSSTVSTLTCNAAPSSIVTFLGKAISLIIKGCSLLIKG